MHGVLNLDKPRGISSQEAVTRARKILKVKKAGHAGTLDPMATGVLLICLGEATKVSRFLMDLRKEYVFTMRFGERTDTLDAEGAVVETCHRTSFEMEEIRKALEGFKGLIRQKPPMYSAIKVSGKPLYKMARKGIEVERKEREVKIHEIELTAVRFPFLTLRVLCSKGTYIRSLAEDIGRALDSCAHMTELRRTKVGVFGVDDSVSLAEVPEKKGVVVSIDDALPHLEGVTLSDRDALFASHGRPLETAAYGEFRAGQYLKLRDPLGAFFAIGLVAGERIKIERLLRLHS
jgi:tRNA pseudouridine55 synthase